MNFTNEFGVGFATIHNIGKNSRKIKYFIKNDKSLKSKHKTLKTGGFSEVDDTWYLRSLQKRFFYYVHYIDRKQWIFRCKNHLKKKF